MLLSLSHFVDHVALQQTLGSYLQMVVPGHSEQLLVQVDALLTQREVVSAVVVAVLLFFSAVAFGILQRAMAVILHHRPRKGRSFLGSVLIPYAFVALLGVGVLLVTFIAGAFDRGEEKQCARQSLDEEEVM